MTDAAKSLAATPKKCRWLSYSLRTALVLITVGCVALGWLVDRAQRQKRAVAAILASGGLVAYADQPEPNRWEYLERFNGVPESWDWYDGSARVPGFGTATFAPRSWRDRLRDAARNLLGEDFFVTVTAATVDGRRLDDEMLAHLANDLPKLKKLFVHHAGAGDPSIVKLQFALPRVEIICAKPRPFESPPLPNSFRRLP